MSDATTPGRKSAETRVESILQRRRARDLAAARAGVRSALRVVPVPREASTPLAIAQERFWFLHWLDPTSPADNVAVALRLDGPLSLDAYQRAWDVIVQRHEVLRSTFPTSEGRAEQHVSPPSPVRIQVHDLSDLSLERAEAEARRLATAEADRPFDLERGPMYRLALYRLPAGGHIALYAFHHIVCDLWSIGVLSYELTALYSAFEERREPEIRPLPFQYADYAACHREWVEGQVIDEALAYWRRHLDGLRVTELPADRPRGPRPGRGATGVVDLPKDLMPAIRALAGGMAATPFMVLTAAISYLLSRYTGTMDVVLGTPIANRTNLDLKGIVGTFVNTLVFRTRLDGVQTFRDLVAVTRGTALSAFEHQHVSFHRLVTDLKPARANSRGHLFQVLFNVQNAPVRLPSLPHVHATPFTLPREAAQFDLTVWVDTDVLQQVGYAYDSSLFDAETVERLIARYLQLLRTIVQQPDLHLDDVDLLLPDERALIHPPETPVAPDDGAATIVDVLDAQACLVPDHIAIESERGAYSYRELAARATALAAHLRAQGVGPGALVGLCLPRTPDLLVALLGVLKAGAAYLPVDPSYPNERVAYMLQDSGTRLVIGEVPAGVRRPEGLQVLSIDDVPATHAPFAGRPAAGDLAYVIYTSGSTGRPKGVEVGHCALLNLLHSMRAEPGIAATDRLLALTTLSFDIAALELFLPLMAGATVVLATREDALDPQRLAHLVRGRRITMMQATPTTWRMLVDSGWPGAPDLAILSGGEPLSRDLAERLLSRGRVVWNLYGPTETTIWSTVARVTSGSGPVSVGRPIANTIVYVLDDRGRLQPPGLPGELVIGGAGLARGYRGLDALTAERFIPDRLSGRSGERLYRTGDRARLLPDGRLELLGRSDDQVKIRGFRIELREVELGLEAVPGVKAAAVAARPDATLSLQLVGFVVSDDPGRVTASAIRDALARRLPPYMVPTQIVFLPALPTTLNGKLDRSALPDTPVALAVAGASTERLSDTQRRLLGIWREELNHAEIGLDEDFFDLGGHSLLAVRLSARLEREFDRPVDVGTVLSARTVRQLGAEIDRRATAPTGGRV